MKLLKYPEFSLKYSIFYFLMALIGASVFTSCIEDGITTSPSDQPTFASDTINLGKVFTEEGTPTKRFMVYNRHDKILNISRVSIRNGGSGIFRVNVDGVSGREFYNVEIRPNDSIYVLVEATLPASGTLLPVEISDMLDFETNGVTSSVVLYALGQDAERLYGHVITRDTVWEPSLPRIIYDSLVVAPGARLTIKGGSSLHFHDKAVLTVDGTLVTEGTPDALVEMGGDRTGNVLTDVSFDIMSNQWGGVIFSPTSSDNKMAHTLIRNTSFGVVADSTDLSLINCRLRNSAGMALQTRHTDLEAIGCELADASMGVVGIHGGTARLVSCTIANYYLFTALGGPAIKLSHTGFDSGKVYDDDESGLPHLKATFDNCIVYGNGSDLSHPDLAGTQVYFRNSLLKSNGSDDDNFIKCIWGEDPLYHTVREDYLFDYRLHADSPAIGAADPALADPRLTVDYYGTPRTATLGAYEAKAEN